jgi:uncharacterized protein (DUF2062 family)
VTIWGAFLLGTLFGVVLAGAVVLLAEWLTGRNMQ